MDGAEMSAGAEAALARVRRRAAELRVSNKMKQVMREEEGAHMQVYRDITGVLTVGVGHVVRPEDGLQVGDVITESQLMQFLTEDLEIAERTVRGMVGDLKLDQHEYDALVDLVFNIGPGNVSADKSPRLHGAIRERDYVAMANELIYSLDRMGRPAPGLKHRSERRRRIFRDKTYDDPRKT